MGYHKKTMNFYSLLFQCNPYANIYVQLLGKSLKLRFIKKADVSFCGLAYPRFFFSVNFTTNDN